MNVLWEKVWFDLWHHKVRSLLAVFSIAAGIFAIGVIFGLTSLMLTGMDESHVASNPSTLNLLLRRPIDSDTAQSLTKIPGVSGVEALNLAMIRYKTAPDAPWQSASLVMREDYQNQRYNLLTLLAGEWPEDYNLGIERLSSNSFNLGIGDEIIVEMDGVDRTFPLTGIIRHPFVPPPEFGGQAYFFSDAQGLARLGIPEGQYFQLYVTIEPYSEAYAKDRAAVIKERLAKQGIGVSIVLYQEPDKHWGRPFVLGMMLVLKILAFVALFASIILVVNTMIALITQQTDQIGIIKAIGGTTRNIAAVYLAEVFVYGLMALLIALPLGLVAAFRGTQWLLNIFNIDYNVFQYSSTAVTLQILAALLAPLLAALWPVYSGARISVREAIASYGLGSNFGSNKFDRFIEHVGEKFLPSLYANALGNMFRHKDRLILTQLVLISAGTMFLLVMTLSNSLTATLDNELARRAYDIRLNFLRPQRAEQVKNLAAQFPGVIEAEPQYSITGNVLREGERLQDVGGLGAELFGVPSGSQMYQPRITDGRWLQPDDVGRVVVISQDMADFNDLAVGDMITVDLGEYGDADWEIIGLYQAIVPEPFSTDPIYAPATAVRQVTKQANQATQLLIRAADPGPAATETLMNELSSLYEARQMGINLFFSRTKMQERANAFSQFAVMTSLLFGLAVVMGLVGGIGLMGSLSISVVERTREIGVLRAIGAQSATMIGMFIMEGVFQGMLSWFSAAPLAFILARPVSRALGQIIIETDLDYTFSYTAVAVWLAIILLISVLASLLPAWNATRISVRESLAYA